EPGNSGQRKRGRLPWLAVVLAALAGGGGAAAIVIARRPVRDEPTVQIAGVTLTRSLTVGKLHIETDGKVEPDELAKLYAGTLDELRPFVKAELAKAKLVNAPLEIGAPVDVLLAVPAGALCEPSAYLNLQTPEHCETALSATAIGARGTHRLMVVS